MLTRYEVVRLVGMRATQLEEGARPLVDPSAGDDPISLAVRELRAGELRGRVERAGGPLFVPGAALPACVEVWMASFTAPPGPGFR